MFKSLSFFSALCFFVASLSFSPSARATIINQWSVGNTAGTAQINLSGFANVGCVAGFSTVSQNGNQLTIHLSALQMLCGPASMPWSTTGSVPGLAAGTYNVTVIDFDGTTISTFSFNWQPAQALPTLSQWMQLLLGVVLATVGIFAMRRRQLIN